METCYHCGKHIIFRGGAMLCAHTLLPQGTNTSAFTCFTVNRMHSLCLSKGRFTHTPTQTHLVLSRTHGARGKHISCSAGGRAPLSPSPNRSECNNYMTVPLSQLAVNQTWGVSASCFFFWGNLRYVMTVGPMGRPERTSPRGS